MVKVSVRKCHHVRELEGQNRHMHSFMHTFLQQILIMLSLCTKLFYVQALINTTILNKLIFY
jgi:hypothetical protein